MVILGTLPVACAWWPSHLILDITGVAVVDTQVAQAPLQTAEAMISRVRRDLALDIRV